MLFTRLILHNPDRVFIVCLSAHPAVFSNNIAVLLTMRIIPSSVPCGGRTHHLCSRGCFALYYNKVSTILEQRRSEKQLTEQLVMTLRLVVPLFLRTVTAYCFA